MLESLNVCAKENYEYIWRHICSVEHDEFQTKNIFHICRDWHVCFACYYYSFNDTYQYCTLWAWSNSEYRNSFSRICHFVNNVMDEIWKRWRQCKHGWTIRWLKREKFIGLTFNWNFLELMIKTDLVKPININSKHVLWC